MQVLKDEIRNSIVQEAKETFLKLGFEKTSMKDIAGKVGVAVGNLYRYYPNKEALFEAVVTPAYDKLIRLIRDNEQTQRAGLSMLEQLAELLSEILHEHRDSFLILLGGSAGTKYERAKDHFYETLAAHVCTHIADFNRSHSNDRPMSMEIARPIAVAFLEGYFEIVRLYSDRNQIAEMTKQYVSVWFMGLLRLF